MHVYSKLMVLATAFMVVSCGQSEATSRVKFRPADPTAHNVAFLVGSENDLPGVARDVLEVTKLIQGSKLGYEVVTLNKATKNQILGKAQEIGKSLSANSTVLFYFSGHGSQDGYLFAQGFQEFEMSEVAKSIGQGANQGQFKRFIAIMDSCFSGQNVDGQEAMFLAGSGSQRSSRQVVLSKAVDTIASGLVPRAQSGLPFEQALIVGASKKNQTSNDMGSSIGGAFTYSWRKIMNQRLNGAPVTLGAVLNEAKDMTVRQTGGEQVPVWKAMPESMLTESLDGSPAALPLAKDIFVALGDAADGSLVFASIPAAAQVASVELCKGEKLACSTGAATKVASLALATNLQLAGRSVYRSSQFVTFAQGDVMTVVLRKNDGSVLEARAFRVKGR
jgi:hypothetical protein